MEEPLRFSLNRYGGRGHANGRGAGDSSRGSTGGDILAKLDNATSPAEIDASPRAKFIDETVRRIFRNGGE